MRPEWKGKAFKIKNPRKTLPSRSALHIREKLALNNPDVIYAFRPELFSTFEIHSDNRTSRFRRETLTVFPSHCGGTASGALPVSGGLRQLLSGPACSQDSSWSGHYPLRGPETYKMKQNGK